MPITEDVILFQLIKTKLTKLFMTLRNLFTILLVALATFVSAQGVVRPLQTLRSDAIESQKLILNKGVFTGKALTLTATTAKASLIPSSLAVYNYVNTKQAIESYTTVTDTVNRTVASGTTVFNFPANQVNFTVTLPADSVAGTIVWLIFVDNVTTVTVSAPAAQTIGGSALVAATGGTTVASYIYIAAPVRKWFRRD